MDLDETLLGPDHTISPRNYRAVRAIVEKGVTVVLASGRMHATARPYAEQLDLDTPIISYNGAMVKRPRTRDVWHSDQVPADLALQVMEYCAEHGLQLNYYLDDVVYTAAMTPWMRLYQERTNCPTVVVPNFIETLRGTAPTKLLIVDSPEFTDRLQPALQERFGSRLYIVKSLAEYLEILPPQSNKAAALALVADRLGFSAETTLAFGDNDNDAPMLRWAGHGVAVANARPVTLAAADRIAPRFDEDGVGRALEEIYQLEEESER
jgi:Cof subfamily protein (haloacid dehalogenase superfamily)